MKTQIKLFIAKTILFLPSLLLLGYTIGLRIYLLFFRN
jgi:hypothetical protein